MAKLKAPVRAGFNAGINHLTKTKKTSDITIDPEISGIFRIDDKNLDAIYNNMVIYGFDYSQPLVLQKGTACLLDGHTRLAAAKKAGFLEVPVVEKDFRDREEAIMYTFERQALRRNLTSAEVITAASMYLKQRKKKDGKGRLAEQLAKMLNVGVAMIYQAKALVDEAPEELVQAVKDGNTSIKAAYSKMKGYEEPKVEKKYVNADSFADKIYKDIAALRSKIESICGKLSDEECKGLFLDALETINKAERRLAILG